MIHRDDRWKIVTVIAAGLAAIAAHTVKLPPAFEPAMPYIEFISALTAVGMGVWTRQSQATVRTLPRRRDRDR